MNIYQKMALDIQERFLMIFQMEKDRRFYRMVYNIQDSLKMAYIMEQDF